MTSESFAVIRQHVSHSEQYMENGLIALRNREAGKAGELFWGSVAQAVHAVAVSRDHEIATHRDLKNFAVQLAKETNDESLLHDFVTAESLHGNFYAIKQEPKDIEIVISSVRRAVNKMLALIPSEALDETTDH